MSAPRPSVLKLAYSLCWEDPLLDLEALGLKPGARVAAIASAGCNVLSLLLADPARVLAVDYNPYQIALTELRIAAAAALERDEFHRFNGQLPDAGRRSTYLAKLAPRLSAASRDFWDARPEWIDAGVNQAGSLERHFGQWRRLMRLVQGERRLALLFESRTPEERRAFFDREWNRWPYRAIVRLFFNRRSLSLAKHPDHFRYVTEPDIAGNFLGKCEHAMTALDVRNNPYLAQIFLGRYLHEDAVPPFLKAGAYGAVRERTGRVEVVTGDLVEALDREQPGSIDAFYLSNICEWLPAQGIERLFESMTRAAAPRARATWRLLLADRRVPERFRDRWVPVQPLSAELLRRDRSFLYSGFEALELR